MPKNPKTAAGKTKTEPVNLLEEQMFKDIRAGKKIGTDISLERALLIASGVDDEEDILAYRGKIQGIYRAFMSRLISEEKEVIGDFSEIDKAMLLNTIINRPINGKTEERRGTDLYSESRIDLVDAVNAYYAKSKDKGANCVGLTTLFTVLCGYASIPCSILVSSDHIKNRVFFGKQGIVIENTNKIGTITEEEKEEVYKEFVEYKPNSLVAFIYSEKASDCIAENEFVSAKRYLDIALKIEPNLFCTHYSLGLIEAAQDTDKVTQTTKRRWRKSIRHFTKAIWLNKGFYEGYTARAEVKLELEDLDSALEDYKRARRINPRRIEAHIGIAYIEMLKDNLKSSRRALRCASEIDPLDPNVHYLDGALKYEAGNYTSAAKAYLFALERDPEHEGARQGLNMIEKRLKDS